MPDPTDQPRAVTELLSLRGKVALVTGATSPLGFAMAAALAEAGASVVAASRSLHAAEDVAAKLPRVGGAVHHGVALDHMDEASVDAAFASAVAKAGRVDVLVNSGHEPLGADWTTVTAEQFNRQLANATGYFLLARLLRGHAISRNAPASVVMVASMYGLVGSYPDVYEDIGAANPVAYQALKGGVVQMTRHLAVYWARDNVRVNCLSPGPFPSDKAPAALVARLVQKSPMRRMGRPEELKGAIVFLASDASSYMTGQNLVIDGGWTAW
jgi:NAD(P)-dependent dehydrogenase (short-subunit alcohol dehydrogenase family)